MKDKQIKINEISIDCNVTVHDALKRMDETFRRLLLVFENNQFINIVSIGDIQRAIIKNRPLSSKLFEILRKKPLIAMENTPFEEIKNSMLKNRIECMPVVNESKKLCDVYFWEDVFGTESELPLISFDLPVVIMAGGFGSRLKPLTNVLPKPLIPIGEKTIIEEIFERFSRHGCNRFFVSLNYKAELIEFYIRNQKLPYDFTFFREKEPMGTAGSLSLLKGKIKDTFFVSNCDIIIEQDYSEILRYHKESSNEITLIAVIKSFPIDYGNIETGDDGTLLNLTEKPQITLKINSGMYILESRLLDEIPEGTFYHITQLIDLVKKRNGKIGVFPVSEGSWKDIGAWEEYKNQF